MRHAGAASKVGSDGGRTRLLGFRAPAGAQPRNPLLRWLRGLGALLLALLRALLLLHLWTLRIALAVLLPVAAVFGISFGSRPRFPLHRPPGLR